MKYTIPLFIAAYVISYRVLEGVPLLQQALRPCGMFYCGMLYDTYRSQIELKISQLLIFVGGGVIFSIFSWIEAGLLLCLPYVLVYLAFAAKRKYSQFGAKREISYEMYLLGFPVQQTVTMLFGGSMYPVVNFCISLPLDLLGAWLLKICLDR